MTYDARKEHFMLVDMDGFICLFTNARLDRDTIPKDLYCYDVRDADCDGTFAEIQRFVMVNHWGTIICKEPIPMNKFHCYWPNRDAFYIPNASLTLDTFHNTPLPELLEPYLSDQGREAFATRLPDMISDIKGKPFMERTGEEQEHLRNYWLFHEKELDAPVHDFLGMTADQYEKWKNGNLLLNDGSYHAMDHSDFRLSDDALRIARQLLHTNGVEQNCSSVAVRNVSADTQHRVDPLIAQFFKHLPEEKDSILSSFFDTKTPNLVLYTPDDAVIAVITSDEILYKEDFADLMNTSGLKPTESHWNAVWKQFSEAFRVAGTDSASLTEQAQAAIAKVQASLTREHMQKKSDLDRRIDSADSRASKSSVPHQTKVMEREPER